MERWIKTRTREMQGKYTFVMDLWKVDKNMNKGNARKIQI